MILSPGRIRSAVVKKRKPRVPYVARPEVNHSHDWWVSVYPDKDLERVYWELRIQNLRDLEDEETRWKAFRLKAVAAERRRRIKAGSYAFPPAPRRSKGKVPSSKCEVLINSRG